MAKLIAIEWDSRELRLATGQGRGARLEVEQAFAIPMTEVAGETDAEAARRVGESLRAALDQHRVGRGEVLLAVGRSSIELKQLSLPPAPDDELPDMVRFQAQRDFHSLGDDWPLDFLPLAGNATEPRSVLAAALPVSTLKDFRAICQVAGLEMTRLVLRPCAAASLLLRREGSKLEPVVLLVDLSSDEADLTVLEDGRPAFLRTTRLPADMLSTPAECRPLVSEVRRTLAATHNQLGGRRVEAIVLCGSRAEHTELARRMETDLSLPVRLFDPFAELSLSRDLQATPPERPGRFAPLLGMLADETQGTPHAIDFLHPRRRPAPPDHTRPRIYAAVAAVAVVGLLGGLLWWSLSSMDAQIAERKQVVAEMKKPLETAKKVITLADSIEAWENREVVWLEELRELAVELPAADQAMLTKLRFTTRDTGSDMEMEGLIQKVSSLDDMEARLRDERHRIEGRGRQQDNRQKPYAWLFTSNINVAPQSAAKKITAEKNTIEKKTADKNTVKNDPATAKGTAAQPAVPAGTATPAATAAPASSTSVPAPVAAPGPASSTAPAVASGSTEKKG